MTDSTVVVALIVTGGTLLNTFMTQRNARKIDKLDHNVDGKLTDFMDLIRASSHAAGVLEEKERERPLTP